MKIVVATKNRGKQSEIRELLSPFGVEVLPMPDGVEVVEDGETYLENARKKAVEVARHALEPGVWVVADDSGIEIDALDGAPGVHSARFLGGVSDEEKCIKILEMLKDRTRRTARFVASLVLADAGRVRFTAEADVPGEIAQNLRGSSGFGYDPIFVPQGHSRTMAEMSSAEKNQLSHRSRAVRALVRYLKYTEVIPA